MKSLILSCSRRTQIYKLEYSDAYLEQCIRPSSASCYLLKNDDEGGVGGWKLQKHIQLSESLLAPLQHAHITWSLPMFCHTPTSYVTNMTAGTALPVWSLQELLYLDLRASRQEGRYLSNRMVKLAFSDWTALLSIQLETCGFQPRSAGFIYRIPGK